MDHTVNAMDTITKRFDGQTRLLVLALMSGTTGVHRALSVFEKQQRCNRQFSLHTFLDKLCQKEISSENDGKVVLALPLVCLFPVVFKRNLLSFLHLVNLALPQTSVVHLLKSLSHDPCPSPWLTALIGQLQRDLGTLEKKPIYSAKCSQRLKSLTERLNDPGRTGGWAKFFRDEKATPRNGFDVSSVGKRRKRKNSFLSPGTDADETAQLHKRMKVEVSGSPTSDERVLADETSGSASEVPKYLPPEPRQPASDLCDGLPEHIKASVSRIKELLACPSEWDKSSTNVFQVLNECDTTQVELLCSMLSLADTPEEMLPKLCSCLLALSPDLSYSAAATVIKTLLLGKVLSLLEPASRCLVTAVTSLCSQYPRAACHTLIRPILQDGNIGTQQAKLLNRIIEDCLEPHYSLLVFQMTFNIIWTEALLSIIHSLLNSKLEFKEELFTDFIVQLVTQAPQFTKSIKFAKMMLTVLSNYSCHVTAAHKQSLSNCLILNKTFLKKSLQAAVKKIQA